ncbi:hypothetical protein ACJIZ3_010726 [Penstemon smallii]|uniref:CENP-V/GFA domain-containing protein n=1 Tax=Penstemon smallii TaxID=265156 RepID=A0ABD3UH54_9LAMI
MFVRLRIEFQDIEEDCDFSFSILFNANNICGSCGTCGYELNLNSCNRNISTIDSKYEKSIKRGVISFFSIDETKFTKIHKVRWLPYLESKKSWILFQRQTKLMCRSCGNYIGAALMENTNSSPLFRLVKSNSATWDGISTCKTYEIKIRSLRPLSSERSSTLLI